MGSGGVRSGVSLDPCCLTLALIGTLLGFGCRSEAPTASGPPVALDLLSGDGQRGRPGEPLERPLVVQVVDAGGRPSRRVDVRWTTTSGEVDPAVATTDANGEAMTVWTLGGLTDPPRATASAEGVPPASFVAIADPDAIPGRIPVRAITLHTYDGSSQVVHPDVVLSSLSGMNDRPRLIVTPYPWGNASFENPSLYEGNAREAWFAPTAATNPVVKPSRGYLSDPDVVPVPDGGGTLRLYYRQVADDNEILLVESQDGITWSNPRVVVRVPSHEAVSPTVVRRSAGDWLMWTVDAGASGCSSATTAVELRRSTDGISWSAPTATVMAQDGIYPWHLDVQWIAGRHEYWALYNGKVAGSCTTAALYLATSPDGIAWHVYPSPVLRRGAIPEFEDIVYRSTFAYDAARDLVSFWYSGARYTARGYEWHAAFERRPRGDLFGIIAASDPLPVTPSNAPGLTNATAP